MLKLRLITAAILAPTAVLAIVYLPVPFSATLFSLFLLAAAWEWTALIPALTDKARLPVLFLLSIALATAYTYIKEPTLSLVSHVSTLIVWGLIGAFIIRHRLDFAPNVNPPRILSGVLVFTILLLGAWIGLLSLLYADRHMLLLVFALVWTADVAAYFTGKRWGKRKLATAISPGKSWEGVFGGIIFSLLLVTVCSQMMVLSGAQQRALIVVGMLAVCASIFGDLFESLLKRSSGQKDSGTILPGHGGMLDRIDGLIAAIPVFSAGFFLWISKL